MKALVFENNRLRLAQKEVPLPQNDEALIRVSHAGICNTDLEIMRGYMGFSGVLGHEFAGVVEQANDPRWLNKRVVGEINLACGKCSLCRRGMGKHCPNRTVLGISGKDGVFADYLTLPLRNLHVVPQEIPDLQAVFTEPLAAACEITEQLEILPEQSVLVIGDGKLGQLIARVLSIYCENLVVVGKHPDKLQRLQKLGVQTIALKDFSKPEQSFRVVVEATGSWQGWEFALRQVEPTGFLVLKSTYAGEHRFNPAPLVINEINVIGSRCGPFATALKLLMKGVVDPTDLISGVFSLDEWEQAFQLAQKPESLKVVFEMPG